MNEYKTAYKIFFPEPWKEENFKITGKKKKKKFLRILGTKTNGLTAGLAKSQMQCHCLQPTGFIFSSLCGMLNLVLDFRCNEPMTCYETYFDSFEFKIVSQKIDEFLPFTSQARF